MYAIIHWLNQDNNILFVTNPEGSIKLFTTLEEADNYADKSKLDSRVVSLESVKS